MPYDPNKHHRRSIRLEGYNYSQPAAYFVTICVQHREFLFGEIVDDEMLPNDAGRMIQRWWAELAHKFPAVVNDVSMVMPNHFHGILIITDVEAALRGHPDPTANVGAALRGRHDPAANVGAALRGRPGHPHRGAPTLGDIMDWFKAMTTNEYIRGVKERGWAPFQDRLWQRGYYEHIVRNERELDRIREYIAMNPARWRQDRENPEA